MIFRLTKKIDFIQNLTPMNSYSKLQKIPVKTWQMRIISAGIKDQRKNLILKFNSTETNIFIKN